MRLTEALRTLPVPGTNSVDGIWERARTRRRRRRVFTTLGVAGVVVATVALSTGLTGDKPNDPTQVNASAACPDPNMFHPWHPSRSITSKVPAGAVSVRLCPIYGSEWQAPIDALTTGVAGLTSAINAMPPLPKQGMFCFSHRIDRYALVFAYPDGRVTRVWADAACYSLTIGSTNREGAVEIRNTFLDSLAQQRRSRTPPVLDQQVQRCPPVEGLFTASLVPSTQLDLTGAMACSYRGVSRMALVHSEPLSVGTARDLSRYLSDHARVTANPDLEMGYHVLTVVARNAWGDNVVVALFNGNLVVESPRRPNDPADRNDNFPAAPLPESLAAMLQWHR